MLGHGVRILTGRHEDRFENPLTPKPTVAEGYDIVIEDGCG